MKKIGNKIISAILAGMMLVGSVPIAGAATVNGLESPIWITEQDVETNSMPTINPWIINQAGMLEITGYGQEESIGGYLLGGMWDLEMYLDRGESIPSNTSYIRGIGFGESFSSEEVFSVLRYVFTESNTVQDTEPRGGKYRFLLSRYEAIGVQEYLPLKHELNVDLIGNPFQKVETKVSEAMFDPGTGVEPYPGTKIEYVDKYENDTWYMVRDIFSYSGNNRHLRLVQAKNGRIESTIEANDYPAYEYSEVCKISNIMIDSTGYKASVTISKPKLGIDEEVITPEQK